MNLKFSDKASAQARADKIHTDLIATDPDYAASVEAGFTKRWAFPYQVVNPDTGLPTDAFWRVPVDARSAKVLTVDEKAAYDAE